MTGLPRRLTAAVSFAVAIILAGSLSAIAATGKSIAPRKTACISNRGYCVRSDDFGSSTWLYNSGEQGFRITKSAASGAKVTADPNIFRGWQWGIGTKGAWPIRVAADGAPRADLTVRSVRKGTYNSQLAMWFSTYPNKKAQANGAELMIWLNYPHVAIGGRAVRVDGTDWYVNSWMTAWHGVSWRLIIFAHTTPITKVKGLWLNPFVRMAQSHGWIKPSWYWTSINAGFELWKGGQGLCVSYFNVNS